MFEKIYDHLVKAYSDTVYLIHNNS